MKILVLTNLYPPHYLGGYELICSTIVNALRARGHQLAVLTSDHQVEPARHQPDEPGVERLLKIHGFYGHPWLGIGRLRKLEAHNNATLRSALHRYKPELVYVWNMGGLSKSMLFTLQATGLPTVFYLSDHWISRGLASDVWLSWWNRRNGRIRQRLTRTVWSWLGGRRRSQQLAPTNPISQLRFPRIYFCSRALRDSTVAAGFDVSHGAVIYCPINRVFLQHDLTPSVGPLQRLLYVGRLAEDKGVMTALRAMALIRDKFDGSLSIYGRGESDYTLQLVEFAGDHHLPVTFTAATPQKMPEVYREHDALLFTSEWDEPFALTPLEAMACGLPVIGTTTGGSAELFRHGDNALTYAAGKPEELADRILMLARDDALRQRCAVGGYCEARQRCAEPVVVDQVEAYLEETLRCWKPMANG